MFNCTVQFSWCSLEVSKLLTYPAASARISILYRVNALRLSEQSLCDAASVKAAKCEASVHSEERLAGESLKPVLFTRAHWFSFCGARSEISSPSFTKQRSPNAALCPHCATGARAGLSNGLLVSSIEPRLPNKLVAADTEWAEMSIEFRVFSTRSWTPTYVVEHRSPRSSKNTSTF